MGAYIQPEEMRIGDIMQHHQFSYKIIEIMVFCRTQADFDKHDAIPGHTAIDRIEQADNPNDEWHLYPCFGVYGTYVEGDRTMYEWFRHVPSVGPECGKKQDFCYDQGNKNKRWYRIEEATL